MSGRWRGVRVDVHVMYVGFCGFLMLLMCFQMLDSLE